MFLRMFGEEGRTGPRVAVTREHADPQGMPVERLSVVMLGIPYNRPLEQSRLLSFYLLTHGRVGRRDFFVKGLLVFFLLGFVTAVLKVVTGSANLSTAVTVAVLWPNLAITARRQHDIDESGGWACLYFAPPLLLAVTQNWDLMPYAKYVAVAGQTILGLIAGTPTGNRFGPASDS